MPSTYRQWLFAAALALSALVLVAMAWLPSTLLSTELGLMFAIPSVILIGIDWATGGFADNDFALAADIVLLLSTAGVYAVLLVLARRMASLLARDRSTPRATLASAVYVVLPPVLAGAVVTSMVGVSAHEAPFSVAMAATVGLAYVVLDAGFGLLARAENPYLPWALTASIAAYGALWLSHVSLALLGGLTLPSLGLLSVIIFTVLAVLLRVAYGLVRRVTRLYASTAEALGVALEATLPEPERRTSRRAALAGAATRSLGFPEQDAALVESASWLKSIIGQGLAATGQGSFLAGEHVALADSLRVTEAADNPESEPSTRFRRLGYLLYEADQAVDPGEHQPRQRALPHPFPVSPGAEHAVVAAVRELSATTAV
jgi:hypothetical protein